MKLTYPQIAQGAVFTIFCTEFLAFSLGLIHVPVLPEDQKFFYMVFGILNTILSVQALAYAVQKDNGYVASTTVANTTTVSSTETPKTETTDETSADTSATV